MALELNHKLSSKEIASLLVHVYSQYVKGRPAATLHPYLIGADNSRVPFAYGIHHGAAIPAKYPAAAYNFRGSLRPEQIEIVKQAFGLLRVKNRLLLSTHVGFGKTILAIYILTQLKLKAVIIMNRLVLINQWKEAIAAFIEGARVCVIAGGDPIDVASFDIFIINLVNVKKVTSTVHDIGVVIIDEVHTALSEKLCADLLYFTPKYLIGLSATPYRSDGSQKIFDFFFGNDTVIFKPLLRAHSVFRVNTRLKIHMAHGPAGRVDWGSVLFEQAENIERNVIIIDIINRYKNKRFLVLCKRVAQIQILSDLLQAAGVPCAAVYGSKQVENGPWRALVGTVQKLGVGFDCKDIDALILGCDVEQYFIQALGRVFRDPAVEPIIFDLVDDNIILRKHYEKRRDVYLSAGGMIQEYN